MAATETTDDVKTIRPPRLGRAPAFPPTGYDGGMPLRTYIATAAMQGIVSQWDKLESYLSSVGGETHGKAVREFIAFASVQQADALLAELAK